MPLLNRCGGSGGGTKIEKRTGLSVNSSNTRVMTISNVEKMPTAIVIYLKVASGTIVNYQPVRGIYTLMIDTVSDIRTVSYQTYKYNTSTYVGDVDTATYSGTACYFKMTYDSSTKTLTITGTQPSLDYCSFISGSEYTYDCSLIY